MPDTDTYTGDTSEAQPMPSPQSFGPVKTLNVERATHIIKKLTDDPSWLADPRTSHAANAVFSAASRVIGMNMQMERAANQSEASRIKNNFTKQKITDLSKVTPLIPVDDVDGQTELGRLNGMVGTQDFNLQEFATGVSRLQSKYKTPAGAAPADEKLIEFAKQYRNSGDETSAKRLEAIVDEHGRMKGRAGDEKPYTITTKDDSGTTVTRKVSKEEYEKLNVLDSEAKAQLGKYAELKSTIAKEGIRKGPDWNPLASDRSVELETIKTKLFQKGIDADTGKRIPPTPAASAPATNAPASDVKRFKWTPEGLVPQ